MLNTDKIITEKIVPAIVVAAILGCFYKLSRIETTMVRIETIQSNIVKLLDRHIEDDSLHGLATKTKHGKAQITSLDIE
jgi:hypothetical protein